MFSGIIVYDSLKDQAWRVMHASMFPDPDFSDYSIDGEMFSLMDGIVGLAHSPSLGLLYYQPLATDRLVFLNKFPSSANVSRIYLNKILSIFCI